MGETHVAALLGNPHLLLDVVVAFAQLAVAVGTDEHIVLFWASREAFWRCGWGFVGSWRRFSLVPFVAQVESHHAKVQVWPDESSYCNTHTNAFCTVATRRRAWTTLLHVMSQSLDVGVGSVDLSL
jgi:hypothetical protein